MIEILTKVPRVKFANLPTPVEALPRLASKLGVRALYIKRDDLTGLAFGGNKTRKLEYFVADASSHGAKTLITAGAVQSNHCRQTAAAAAKFGYRCKLVLTGKEPERASANLLLDKLLGAELIWCSRDEREETLQKVFQDAWNNGERPYLIPYGGSNVLGAMGYVAAMDEFAQQDVEVEWVVFASSSGGTQAGMLLGKTILGMEMHILGISVDESASILRNKIFKIIHETINTYPLGITVSEKDIEINDEYRGEGYGIPTSLDIEAVQLFAREEGILLDPVYTGRAAAGMIDLIRKGVIPADSRVLFWHTGGNTSLFAGQYEVPVLRGLG